MSENWFCHWRFKLSVDKIQKSKHNNKFGLTVTRG